MGFWHNHEYMQERYLGASDGIMMEYRSIGVLDVHIGRMAFGVWV